MNLFKKSFVGVFVFISFLGFVHSASAGSHNYTLTYYSGEKVGGTMQSDLNTYSPGQNIYLTGTMHIVGGPYNGVMVTTYGSMTATISGSSPQTYLFQNEIIYLNGGGGQSSTSGAITFTAPSVAGSYNITFQADAFGELELYNMPITVTGTPPIVINPTSTSITGTSATLGANVTSLGNPPTISARGVCYSSVNINPTLGQTNTTCVNASGVTLGVFTVPVSGLSLGTTYYYRGYATNAYMSGYTNSTTFTTTGTSVLLTLQAGMGNDGTGKDLVRAGSSGDIGTTRVKIVLSNLPANTKCILDNTADNVDITVKEATSSITTYEEVFKNRDYLANNNTLQVKCTNTLTNASIANSSTLEVKGQSGTLTGNAPCVIPLNSGSCNLPVTWATTNPGTSSGVQTQIRVGSTSTGDLLYSSATGATGGTPSVSISGSSILTNGSNSASILLKSWNKVDGDSANSSVSNELDQLSATVSCSQTPVATVWNGSKCVASSTPKPDLIALTPTVSPASPVAGSSTTLSSVIKNAGTASTGAGFYNFFQVSNTDPSSGGSGMGFLNKTSRFSFISNFISNLIPRIEAATGTITDLPAVWMNALDANGQGTTTKDYTFTSNGIYWVRACADKEDKNDTTGLITTESNEDNNCSEWLQVIVGSAPINGQCSSPAVHYDCAVGTSINHDNPPSLTHWTWQCQGENGGTTASCSQAKPVSTPTVITKTPVTSITQNTAVGGGNITANGGSAITVSGIVWGKLQNPTSTVNLGKTTNGSTTVNVPWSNSMTGLTAGTVYHYRAYATNSMGTSYGADVSFITLTGTGGETTGTLSATDCIIPENESFCDTFLTWTTENPVGISAVTSDYPSANTTVFQLNSGTNKSAIVPYDTRKFYLYHQEEEIAPAVNPKATCIDGTVWDLLNKKCVVSVPPPGTGIDLIASNTWPTDVSVGATVFSSTITNQGTVSTGGSFTNLFQTSLSPSGTNPTDYATSQMSALGAGSSDTATKSISFSAPGTYYMRACADKSSAGSTGVINEGVDYENNNCRDWVPVEVTCPTDTTWNGSSCIPGGEYPDLALTGLWPTTVPVGTSTFNTTVQNYGENGTGGHFHNFFQVSTEPNGGGTITPYIATPYWMGPLDGLGGEANAEVSISFPTDGTYYMRACADKDSAGDTGDIVESNENNNCTDSWVQITIGNGSPVGSLNASDCEIGLGESTCSSALSWGITNPVPSAATSITVPEDVTVPGTSTVSGNTTYSIDYGTIYFSLNHNGETIKTDPATATCAPNSSWDGSKCEAGSVTLGDDYWLWECGSCNNCWQTCTGECIDANSDGVLSCSGSGSITQSCGSCVITPPGGDDGEIVFTANPSLIFRGRSSILEWNSSADSCTGDTNFNTGAGDPPNGSVTVNPTQSTTTYVITCKKGLRNIVDTATVKVINPIIRER